MTLKKALKITAACLLAVVLLAGVFSASAASDDPADSYVKQTAPYEDPDIDLWFDYSFRKTFTSDTTSTGMDTFSVYMAKNEIESAQFVLYSDTDKTGMLAEVTDFTDGDGHTIPADIYYEMYVTTSDLNTQSLYGTSGIIREGETPDPILEMSRLGKTPSFKLNGGKSQAFLIRIKSAEDTPAGWYSAQLDIKNANGQVVKTATVYCHVWDFVISEETRFRSAFYIGNNFQYGGNYQQAYDYLLENRLNAMDIPSMSEGYKAPRSDSPYITNPRVNSVRITSNGGGNSGSYMDYLGSASYLSIYEELSASPNWDVIKDKLYFYNVDEPLPYELVGDSRDTTDKVKSGYYMAKLGWPDDTRFLVTVCEDCAYYSPRENYYTKPLDQYPQEQIKDSYQEMIDTDTVQIWCAAIYNLTPYDELLRYGQPFSDVVNYTQAVRSAVSNVYSGSYGTLNAAHWGGFDWNAMYGDPFNRFMSHIIKRNAEADTRDNDLWMYSANENTCYTYTNHIIENTGLQTKLMCWQAYQCDVNGYLYFFTMITATILYLLYGMFHDDMRKILVTIAFVGISVSFIFMVDFAFNNILQPHQQNRIKVTLGIAEDPRGVGYNVNQSKIAIGSGGMWGKGYLNGTQTKLKYVPEQHTDFIFCTIGEEEGFVGTTAVLLLFLALILRIIHIAERQHTKFGRVYAYCVASYFIFHLAINIGMVIGLCPVIGIPLPFFSYGGSSLWGFTFLLFILLRIDADRKAYGSW